MRMRLRGPQSLAHCVESQLYKRKLVFKWSKLVRNSSTVHYFNSDHNNSAVLNDVMHRNEI